MKKPRCKYKKEINIIQIISIKNKINIFSFDSEVFLKLLFQIIKSTFCIFFFKSNLPTTYYGTHFEHHHLLQTSQGASQSVLVALHLTL